MTTNTMTSPPRTNRLHYAWVVLATTTLVLLASGGVRAAIGVFVKPLEAEFGWSRTALSFAVAVSIALYGLTGPFVGRLADRWGPRWVLTGGVALVGIGTMAGAGVTQFWQFFVAVGLIAAIGSSATAAPVAATVATRWFDRHRGLVLGINGAGMAAGQLVVLPVAMGLVAVLGWRGAYLALGAALLVIVVPLTAVLMRNDPSERGLLAYGATAPPPCHDGGAGGGGADPGQRGRAHVAVPAPLRQLLGLRILDVRRDPRPLHPARNGSRVPAAPGRGGPRHHGRDEHRGHHRVGMALRPGWPQGAAGPLLSLPGVSLFFLPYVTTVPGLFTFAALFGLNFISTVPATTTLTARIYGRYSVGELSGWIFASHQLGGPLARSRPGGSSTRTATTRWRSTPRAPGPCSRP